MEDKDKKVDSAEKLQSWIDNADKLFAEQKQKIETLEADKEEREKQLEELKAENMRMKEDFASSLNALQAAPSTEADKLRKLDYEIGKWWCNYRIKSGLGGSDKALRCMRNLKMDSLKADPAVISDGTQYKADLGTPLTGDASGTDAQYLVPQTVYETEILRTMMTQSEVIPRFRMKQMTGRLHRYPVESTQLSLTYVTNEVTDKTESNPTWTYVDLECETFATWIGVTDELMEDTFADIGAQIRVQAMEAYKNTVETQLLNGSGSPFTGILQNGSVNSLAMGSNSFNSVSWADCLNLIEQLTTSKQRQGAVFMMHPTIWDLLAQQQDGMGRYYFLPTQAVPRSISAYPVLLSDNMPSLSDSAADTAFIAFGDPRYTLYGIRMGLEFRYFDQTMYAVQDDENFWRVRTRIAGVVGIPGNYAVLKTSA